MNTEKLQKVKKTVLDGAHNVFRLIFTSKKNLSLGEIVRKNQYLRVTALEVVILISSIAALFLCKDILFLLMGILIVLVGLAYCISIEGTAMAGNVVEVFGVCVSQEPVYNGFGSGMVNRMNKKSLQIYRFVTTTENEQEVSIFIKRTKNSGFRIGAVYLLSFNNNGNELSEENLIGSILVQTDMRPVEDVAAQERKARVDELLQGRSESRGG